PSSCSSRRRPSGSGVGGAPTRLPTMPLDPEIQALLAAMASLNAPPLSQGTPEAARAGFRFMTVDMRRPEHVIAVKETEDVRVPTSHVDIAARIYRPDHDVPVPTVVFAH